MLESRGQKGDHVIISPKLASASWIFLDFAIQQLGAIVVPCHSTNLPVIFEQIITETEPKACFFADESSLQHLVPNKAILEEIPFFYSNEIKRQTEAIELNLDFDLIKKEIAEEDVCTLMYTSGTSGLPKGVMLSHSNLMSNLKCVLPLMPFRYKKVGLSFLPYSHILERSIVFAYITTGMTLYLAGNRENVRFHLKRVRPHYFTVVPRILERMYDQLLTQRAQSSLLKRKMIDWALNLSSKYRENKRFYFWFWVKVWMARWIVLNKFKRMLGGRVEVIYSGAAYLNPKIVRIFSIMGIKVREGYGMTETSPVISLSRIEPGMHKIGTVGLPIPCIDIQILNPNESGEGEIAVKGPNVMLGYYKKPEETKLAFTTDGWFKTGDIGRMVDKRFLQVTDRKKDIFKTSSGKYIAPVVIENHFRQSRYIDQIMIIGFQRPYLVALIKPNFDLLKIWSETNGIHWTSPPYMVLNIKIKQKIQKEIDSLNESLPGYQRLIKFHLFAEEWSAENGELTYTMKLIRPKILDDFEKEIVSLYQ